MADIGEEALAADLAVADDVDAAFDLPRDDGRLGGLDLALEGVGVDLFSLRAGGRAARSIPGLRQAAGMGGEDASRHAVFPVKRIFTMRCEG